MVLLHIGNALLLEQGNALGVENELFNFFIATFVGRQDIDDGSEFLFAKDVIVLGLSTTDVDDAF